MHRDILAGALGRPLHSAGDGLVTLPLPTPGSEPRWQMLPGTLLRACLPANAWGQQAGGQEVHVTPSLWVLAVV